MSPLAPLPVGLNGLALAWESVAALLGALVAGLAAGAFLRVRSGRRAPPEAISPERERELESLSRIAAELARTSDVEGVARALLDEISSLFAVGFVALTFVSDDAREGAGFLARKRGKDVDWWPSVRVDLEREPSGIASAVHSAASFTVYDVATSTKVSSRLAKEVDAKSAAFVPLISDSGVIAVISVATTDEQRVFSVDDLGVMQTLASEATIALERTRSALALGEALARERLLSDISRRLRTELDLDAALTATVEEAGRALGAARCFVRLGDYDGNLPVIAHWHAARATPLGLETDRLPGSNLAARTRGTVVVGDLDAAPELLDPSLGGLDRLRALGTRALVSTPIVVEDRTIGVLTAHRDTAGAWSRGDVLLDCASTRSAGPER